MSFLDGFADSFSRTFSTSGWETRAERERRENERRLAEEAAAREERRLKLEEEQQPGIIAGREAQTRLQTEQAASLAYANTPEQRALTDRLVNAQIDKALSDVEFQAAEKARIEELTKGLAYANTPEQRELANQKLQTEIDGLQAAGSLNQAQADKLNAELPYVADRAQAEIANIQAQTRQGGALAEKQEIENEIQRRGPLQVARELFRSKYGGLEVPAEGALPENPALREAAPPETPTAYQPSPIQPVARPAYTEEAPPPAPSRAVLPSPYTQGGPPTPAATRPTAIPYTAGTRAEAPLTTPTPEEMRRTPAPQVAPPPRTPIPYSTGTPQEPLDTGYTYRPEPQEISYRPGEGRVIEAQAGTRSLPLNDRTRTMLEQASAATGLDVRVTSGAQPSSGPNRTGSHRHDEEVGSGDVQLIDRATGEVVSMETAEGQQRIVEFMRAARDAGATGFGAGVDYMGPTTIHVGFGEPAVWGAGGKSANAPDWLVEGMSGEGGRPSAIPAGAGARPAGVARAYQGLQQRDMPQMQAAVLAGNIQQESSGNPNSVNQAEGAEGIIQWRQDRLAKLKEFAGDKDYRDLDVQLDFLMAEGESLGSGQDKAAWQEFMSATTPEAANAALKKFIRYGDESEGTRLEYAENLLRGGGEEIIGERGLLSEATGRRRAPTPRGEVGQNVYRYRIQQTAITAAIEGAKAAVQEAGLGGPMPAITEVGRDARVRGFVSGQGAASPQALASAQEAVQKTFKEPVSQDVLNEATLAYAYDYALMVEGNKEKAQGIAKEIYQAYKKKADQFMALAKVTAQNGDLDKAAQIAAKAYAYIPDGQEATFSKDQNGNYLVTVKDGVTGKTKTSQVVPPDEMFNQIMGWSSVSFDKAIRRAAGERVPSEAFEAYSGAAQVVTGLTPEQVPFGQALPELPTPDISQMTEEGEAGQAMDLYRAQLERAKTSREGLEAPKPWSPAEMETIKTEIEAAVGPNFEGGVVPPEVMERLRIAFGDNPQNLQSTLYSIKQYNPNIPVPNIMDGLDRMLTPQVPTDPNRGPTPTFRSAQDREQGVMVVTPTGTNLQLVMDPRTFVDLSNRVSATSQNLMATTREKVADIATKEAEAATDVARSRRATSEQARRYRAPVMAPRTQPAIPEQFGPPMPLSSRARPRYTWGRR